MRARNGVLFHVCLVFVLIFFLSGCVSQEIQIGPGGAKTAIPQTEIPTTTPITIPPETSTIIPITTIPPSIPPSSSCIIGYQDNLLVISWKCADQYYEKEVIVEGVIVFTFKSIEGCELNFYYDEIDEALKKATEAASNYDNTKSPEDLDKLTSAATDADRIVKEHSKEIGSALGDLGQSIAWDPVNKRYLVLLNYGTKLRSINKKFTVIIASKYFNYFSDNPDVLFFRKKVRVRGIIEEDYNWIKPVIRITNPSQIWVIG